MTISLSQIMSVKNKTECIKAPLELTSFRLDGMEYDIIKKEEIELEIVSKEDKEISFAAKTKLSLNVPCGRCLEDVEVFFDIQVAKDLDFKDTEEDRIKDMDEINYIDGYTLDVDLLIYDEILINFPLQTLCEPGCKGICKVCGKNLNKESCDCDQSVGDPRMSVIQDIFKNYKEV